MTQIPYADPGRASFEVLDTYTQGFLLAGQHPELAPAFSFEMAASVVLTQFAVVGLNAAGKLDWATDDYNFGSQAAQLGTFSGVGTADDTITVGADVYVLKAAPTTVARQVKIGATAAETAANLIAAINADPAGAGTLYGSLTVEHPNVSARSNGGADVAVVAKVPGTAGNAIATTDAGTGFSWTAVTLTGGLAAFGVRAMGVVPHAITSGASDPVKCPVWYSGCFNKAALQWGPTFNTDAKKLAAFRGAPTPTNIIVAERG